MGKLWVSLFVSQLRVCVGGGGGGRRRSRRRRTEAHNQKQEPHTMMWGMIQIISYTITLYYSNPWVLRGCPMVPPCLSDHVSFNMALLVLDGRAEQLRR